jgi:hypothetical protein
VYRWATEVLGLAEEDAKLLRTWRGRFLADASVDQVPMAMSSAGAAKLAHVISTKNWGVHPEQGR